MFSSTFSGLPQLSHASPRYEKPHLVQKRQPDSPGPPESCVRFCTRNPINCAIQRNIAAGAACQPVTAASF